MSENNKILLVDDEYDIALAFSLGLQSGGFSVDLFNNPMPEMDGIELAQKIKDKDKKIKICLITAFDLEDPRIKEFSPCIIKKPISMDDLIKKLQSEINRN